MSATKELEDYIFHLTENKPSEMPADFPSFLERFLSALEHGVIRSAEKIDGKWSANAWVKQGILLGFKFGKNVEQSMEPLPFFDKNTYPVQKPLGVEKNIRIVPGGSSIRRGSFIGSNVTMMPPMYVNVGAYIGDGTMIDSHALVGSCAQVGKNVHVSAAAQLGGVLEPIGATPVVIEDNCMIGGNTGIYEGTQVLSGAVIGAGVVLTRSIPVYDLVNNTFYKGTADKPLVIPENAVVVPGSRTINTEYAREQGLSLHTAIIIKYRDDKTDAATTLEALLR